jgi:hypothetical protein
MKVNRILCLAAALVLPQLALAELPFPNDAFGKTEGILDFCTQVDPQDAPKYQEQKKALVRDVPKKEVEEARQTQEYREAYHSTSDELAKVPKDKAVKACTDFLQRK